MIWLWRNPEFKAVFFKLLVFQTVLAAVFFIYAGVGVSSLSKGIANQNTALAGKILGAHPELENELIPLITKEATPEQAAQGSAILKKYGYTQETVVYLQPVLGRYGVNTGAGVTLLAFIFFIPLALLISHEYNKIYQKVRNISNASEKVVEGDFSFLLPEDREGDFGILGHSFNQMANRLKLSMDTIRNEKIFLKDIISDISHQLKTPLSSLITFNELLLTDQSMDPGTRDRFLEKSRKQLDRMEWLIISLLKMARLEAGAITFKKEKVLSVQTVEAATAALNTRLEAKGQGIVIEGNRESAFIGDPEWTAEAITNIIKNSSEHSPEGSEIVVAISETPLFSRVSIRDSGEGIDEKDLPHIFERFYRGNSSVKPEGIGIGLALSKLIVEGQNGSIYVRSVKGAGSEFTLTFPKEFI